MKKIKKLSLFIFLFFLFCGRDLSQRDYNNLREALRKAKNAEEKASLIQDFLIKYPNSNYAVDFYYDLMKYEKPENLENFFVSLKEKTKNPENLKELNLNLLSLYGKLKDKEKILEIFKGFEKPLNYSEFNETIRNLIEAEGYREALDLIEEFEPLCEMEKVEKDLERLSKERIDRAFKRRNFFLWLYKGKIYYGLMDYERAIFSYEKGSSFLKPSYVGTYIYDLNYFWALALYSKGEKEKAMEKILPDVLFERNEKNYSLFEKIYREIYNSKEEIEKFLSKKLEERAPLAQDFLLKDYKGEEYKFFDKTRDKVVLLTFWFPT